MKLEGLLEAGMESLRAGRLVDARAAFLDVLKTQPAHPDAHYLLAHAAFVAGQLVEAERCLGLALLYGPGRAEFHLLLGNVLQRQGKLERADEQYLQALRCDPRLAEAHLNRGNVLGEKGQVDQALAAYDAALARNPGLLAAVFNRAALLKRVGRRDEARQVYDQLLAKVPTSGEALYGRARLEHEAGDLPEARRRYEALLAAHPAHAHGCNGLGALRLEQGDTEAALALFERSLQADPQHREALANAAGALRRLGRAERAAGMYRRLLRAQPDRFAARLALGRLLIEAGRYGEALQELLTLRRQQPDWHEVHLALCDCYSSIGRFEKARAANARALALQPEDFGARVNRGLLTGQCGDPQAALAQLEPLLAERSAEPQLLSAIGVQLCALNRYEEGAARFRQAVEANPQYANAHNNLSFALLALGRFREGWRHQGMKWGMRENARFRQELDCPLWRGEPLAGKSIYVWSEQGLGDQVMFANMFPDLVAAGARCTFEVQPRLRALFARSFPQAQVIARRPGKPQAGVHDFHVPMSGLGEFLRNDLTAFPAHRGYLVADPTRRGHWRSRLLGLGAGLKVGISWRGGTDVTDRGQRSIPLADWRPVLRLRRASFVSLQYGDCREEIEAMRAQGFPIAHWQEAVDDMDESAALLCELDLVISVTTTAIHLAGALARPTWVLVPARPGWRYLLEGERLPWYPAARMLRQGALGDWTPVMARVAEDLAVFSPA